MHNWKQEQRANDYRHPALQLTEKARQSVTAQAHDYATPRPTQADAVYRQNLLEDTADA